MRVVVAVGILALVVVVACGQDMKQQPNGGGAQKDNFEPSGFVFQQHSLKKPYFSKGMTMAFWDFIGNAVVTDDYIRLTPDRQSKRGAIWNTRPLTMKDWEVTVQFKVHGQGQTLFGDGFAFWFTQHRNSLGQVFGSRDKFSGLGIFFDTYNNQKAYRNGAYISGMVNDGTIEYDHDQDGTHQEIASCQENFRNVDHDTYFRVSYVDRTLRLLVDFDNKGVWKTCFFVGDIFLPRGLHIGMSAATGDLADNHDIISVWTAVPAALSNEDKAFAEKWTIEDKASGKEIPSLSEEVQKPFAARMAEKRDHVGEQRKQTKFNINNLKKLRHQAGDVDVNSTAFDGSWILYIAIIVIVVAGIGGIVYKTQVLDKKSAKRFEF
eukprot:m.14400 g.14400  ORF g.14400 m.14400 type:complete len:378 (+) comp4302_c0_seq1:35-1168(+)